MNTLLLYYQRTSEIDDKMLWKKEAIEQMIFMRDIIGFQLFRVPVFMIGEHMSKSISLPVYGMILRNGIKVIAEGDFHSWVVSVELPSTVSHNISTDLFVGGVEKEVPYCYGFKESWKYGCYRKDCRKFTVELRDRYHVFTLMFSLKDLFPETPLKPKNVEWVKERIEDIYVDNGVYELENIQNRMGLKNPTYDSIMSGWELLWWTKSKLSDTIGYKDSRNIADNPEQFASLICEYPEVMQEFLIEERGYEEIWK